MKAKQLTVYVQDAPGALGRVARALADKKVNITGLFALAAQDKSPVRLVVDSPARAKKALQAAGLEPVEENVLVTPLADKPGALATVAEKLGSAGINIQFAYASGGVGKKANLVVGVADVAAAERALKAKG